MADMQFLDSASFPTLPDVDPSNPDFSTALDSLPLPDDDFSLPEGLMADLNFDEDLDFSIEDIFSDLPFGNEEFPDYSNFKDGSGISSLSDDAFGDRRSIADDIVMDSHDRGYYSGSVSGDRCTDVDRVLKSVSPDCCGSPDRCSSGSAPGDRYSDAVRVLNSFLSPDRVVSGSVSGHQCLDFATVLKSASPDCCGSPDHCSSGSAPGDRYSDAARVLNSSASPDRVVSGSVSGDRCLDVARVLKSASPDCCGSPDRCSSGSASGDRNSDAARVLNSSDFFGCPDRVVSGSDRSNAAGVSNPLSPDSECRDQGVLVSRVVNVSSPDSASSDREFSGSSSLDSSNIPSVAAGQKMKLEDGSKGCLSKRKKGNEDGNTDHRSSKFRRSITSDDGNSPLAGNDEDDKRQSRLMRNRESAQLSRQRKKHYVEELEDKLRSMHSTIAELNSKITFVMTENASLRQQLGGGVGGVCAPGIYPPTAMPPMHFPWVPCSPYALKPQGSQVPLIPIPRLKPQPIVSASKSKKSDSKKAESKTKKVASVSFMGLLFFLLIFGGLVPFVNINYAGIRTPVSGRLDYANGGFDGGKSSGRVLMVSGHLNGSDQKSGFGLHTGKGGCGKGDIEGIVRESEGIQNGRGSQSPPGVDGYGLSQNASEPLVASLYVPRNDKLVKIDGNLIIHSVLASEKAVASSRSSSRVKNAKTSVSSDKGVVENGLAIPGDLASAVAVSKSGRDIERHSHMYRSPTERPKALTSGNGDSYRDNPKSMASDGPLQQWFREGLAGPILSSGMCTEVFQFEVSPTSSAIIAATSVVNVSSEHSPDSARSSKMKNRRILYHPPIPFAGSSPNGTEHTAKSPKDNSFHGNKSISSSMIVSVLVDPREAGDGDVDQRIAPKSLSRIFVVVLLDSVKYVTYSCVLPLKGSVPHLVTA